MANTGNRPILFVRKLIRIRRGLDKAGVKQKPVGDTVKHLQDLLDYNNYNQRQSCSFFVRKKDMILDLIPGVRCNSHKALMAEYLELVEYSEQILNHDSIAI